MTLACVDLPRSSWYAQTMPEKFPACPVDHIVFFAGDRLKRCSLCHEYFHERCWPNDAPCPHCGEIDQAYTLSEFTEAGQFRGLDRTA